MAALQILNMCVGALVGLCIGSFLNVAIHRLPKMLERDWMREMADFAGTAIDDMATYNLFYPRSKCPQCSHLLRWHENIPVFSYFMLNGRCASCKTRISKRYPTVEVAMSVIGGYFAWNFGLGLTAIAWASFAAALVTLAMIDYDTLLLPDAIVVPLIWAGLVAAQFRWSPVGLPDALWGAVGGYLSLWIVYWSFKLLTKKEGMGYGDFKLFAALGAWFGWQGLVPVILIASIVCLVVGVALKFTSGLREHGQIPFGPFLAGAGLIGAYLGPFGLRALF